MPHHVELIGHRELGERPGLGLPEWTCDAAAPVYHPRGLRVKGRVRGGPITVSVEVDDLLRPPSRGGDDLLPVDAGKALREAVRAVRRVQATGVDDPRVRAPPIQEVRGAVEMIAE